MDLSHTNGLSSLPKALAGISAGAVAEAGGAAAAAAAGAAAAGTEAAVLLAALDRPADPGAAALRSALAEVAKYLVG